MWSLACLVPFCESPNPEIRNLQAGLTAEQIEAKLEAKRVGEQYFGSLWTPGKTWALIEDLGVSEL